MNAKGHIMTNKSVNSLECVVGGAIWTVDIALGSSVAELLIRVACVIGSIPGPLYLYTHSSFPSIC